MTIVANVLTALVALSHAGILVLELDPRVHGYYINRNATRVHHNRIVQLGCQVRMTSEATKERVVAFGNDDAAILWHGCHLKP